jgi:hypothetical protein
VKIKLRATAATASLALAVSGFVATPAAAAGLAALSCVNPVALGAAKAKPSAVGKQDPNALSASEVTRREKELADLRRE